MPGNGQLMIISIQYNLHSETLKGSNESGLLQQVVFKCRFYWVDLRRVAVSEQWSLKSGGLLIQVVSNTGLTVLTSGNVSQTLCWIRDVKYMINKSIYER